MTERIRMDPHGHTKHEDRWFPGMKPTLVIEHALTMGLAAIAICEHDAFMDPKIAKLAQQVGLLVIAGIEITAHIKTDDKEHWPHMSGLGVIQDEEEIPINKEPIEVAQWIKRHHGIVVAPHPKKRGDKHSFTYDEVLKLCDAEVIDAVEILTLFGWKRELEQSLNQLPEDKKVAFLGSSDFHWPNHIGRVATDVLLDQTGSVITQDAILNTILNRQTKPVEQKPYPKIVQELARVIGLLSYGWTG